MPSVTCLRCGHQWMPAVPQPKSCPRCKSYYWNEPRKQASSQEVEA
jgi:predicted Zn-ribbon and HTH transcriptional regulator